MATTQEKASMLKRNLFKGTIAVSVLYATIALLLLSVIYFTESGKQMAEGSKFPFIISFTIGMLVIIAFLIYNIVTFKTKTIERDTYDDTLCPDYWKLQKTPDTALNSFTSPEQKVGKDLQCVSSGKSTNIGPKVLSKNTTNADEKLLVKNASVLYGTDSVVYTAGTNSHVKDDTQVKIDCSKLYPKSMSSLDISEHPEEQNALRCAYTNQCQLTWSSICPASL